MRSFLVTGGAGFIGSHLATGLVRRGDRVRILDNLSTGHMGNLAHLEGKFEFIEGDLIDPDAVAKAVQGVEVVYHQAALSSVPRSVERPLDTHAACVTGTLILLEAARKAQVRRLVYAGSSSAYGDQATASKSEKNLPAPLSPYAAAKLAGEYYCQAYAATYQFETVSLRYFNVFGPRQDPNSEYSAVIPLFITAILSGKQPTIYGDGHQSRDFTYIDNVVEGNLLAADAPNIAGQVMNVACGQSVTLLELLAAVNSLLGTDVQAIHVDPRQGDVRESLADISKARELLGYEPRIDFKEGLRRSIEYYRSVADGN